jgi:creatinine amidohydrolase
VLLADMTWPRVSALPKHTPVVLPLAALEQHGEHLPVFTDSLLVGEITRRAERELAERILLAPVMWLGNSAHHLDFPGTMSAAPRTYIDLVDDMVENFLMHGFQRIVLVNGHGGNNVPGEQAVFECRQRHRDKNDLLLLFACYWAIGGGEQSSPDFEQTAMGHACEWETSMILRLAPNLVGDLKAIEPVPFGNPFEPGSRGWITKDRSAPGHIGDPRQASAEKGETLFRLLSGDVVTFLERVIAWDGRSWDG